MKLIHRYNEFFKAQITFITKHQALVQRLTDLLGNFKYCNRTHRYDHNSGNGNDKAYIEVNNYNYLLPALVRP